MLIMSVLGTKAIPDLLVGHFLHCLYCTNQRKRTKYHLLHFLPIQNYVSNTSKFVFTFAQLGFLFPPAEKPCEIGSKTLLDQKVRTFHKWLLFTERLSSYLPKTEKLLSMLFIVSYRPVGRRWGIRALGASANPIFWAVRSKIVVVPTQYLIFWIPTKGWGNFK